MAEIGLRSASLTIWAFILIVSAAAIARAAEPVFAPGSNWGLVLPAGFVAEPAMPTAFTHPSGAMIVVVTSTQLFERSRFTPVGSVAGQGENAGRVISIDDVTVGGNPAFLMRLRMINRDADSIAMLINGKTAGFVTAVLPDQARGAIAEEAVLAALYSAVERELTVAEQLSGLPVSIGDVGGMRVSGNIGSQGVILTDGPGSEVAKSPDQTFVTLVAWLRQDAEGYLLTRDAEALSRLLRDSFAGIETAGSQRRQGAQGEFLEVTFTRQIGGVGRPGFAWCFLAGETQILMVVQLPAGKPGDAAMLDRMRESVAEK